MKSVNRLTRRPARGFSLLEMMVVIVIVSIVIAAVLTQVNQTQQRATAEQGKLDQFQAARNFVDQISTDARQMGYPNIHNVDSTTLGVAAGSPYFDSNQIAAGLLKLTNNQLVFEGDVDGSGTVSIVSYTVNGDGACATCLERAQVAKTANAAVSNSAYLTAALALVTTGSYSAQIQNVQNATSATTPIFKAFSNTGAAIALPIDIGTSAVNIANVRTIQISLDVSDPTKVDPKTNQALEANITSRVQIVNCSMATTGLSTPGGLQLTCQ